jgi:hypothetical protein
MVVDRVMKTTEAIAAEHVILSSRFDKIERMLPSLQYFCYVRRTAIQ